MITFEQRKEIHINKMHEAEEYKKASKKASDYGLYKDREYWRKLQIKKPIIIEDIANFEFLYKYRSGDKILSLSEITDFIFDSYSGKFDEDIFNLISVYVKDIDTKKNVIFRCDNPNRISDLNALLSALNKLFKTHFVKNTYIGEATELHHIRGSKVSEEYNFLKNLDSDIFNMTGRRGGKNRTIPPSDFINDSNNYFYFISNLSVSVLKSEMVNRISDETKIYTLGKDKSKEQSKKVSASKPKKYRKPSDDDFGCILENIDEVPKPYLRVYEWFLEQYKDDIPVKVGIRNLAKELKIAERLLISTIDNLIKEKLLIKTGTSNQINYKVFKFK